MIGSGILALPFATSKVGIVISLVGLIPKFVRLPSVDQALIKCNLLNGI